MNENIIRYNIQCR